MENNEFCPVCRSTKITIKHITSIAKKTKGISFNFIICNLCGFINNPENKYDYIEKGFLVGSMPDTGSRAGDGKLPRREYRIAEMALEIMQRKSFNEKPNLLIFGAGLSKDHELISAELKFNNVNITDIGNFQNSEKYIPMNSSNKFDVIIASEVIEHFTDIDKDFSQLFSKLNEDGLLIAGTNIHDYSSIEKLVYPFSPGHTSYYTGESLFHIAKKFDMKLDFRTPAIGLKSGGPRKRYIFLFKNPIIGEYISYYFANHHLAPSE